MKYNPDQNETPKKPGLSASKTIFFRNHVNILDVNWPVKNIIGLDIQIYVSIYIYVKC